VPCGLVGGMLLAVIWLLGQCTVLAAQGSVEQVGLLVAVGTGRAAVAGSGPVDYRQWRSVAQLVRDDDHPVVWCVKRQPDSSEFTTLR
jgi:hypothetical protein